MKPGLQIRVGATLAVVPVMQRITSKCRQPGDDRKGRPYARLLPFIVIGLPVIIARPPAAAISCSHCHPTKNLEKTENNA